MMRPFSTLPFFCSSRQYSQAWRHMLKVPLRCTAITASQSSSAMLKIIRSRRMPALLTTMLSLPKVSIAHSTIRLAALKSATLSPLAIAWPPRFLISATTSCAGVAVAWPVPSKWAPRSFTTILAPCCAMRSACSRPMPRPEPVMIATLPSSNIEASFGRNYLPQAATPCQGSNGSSDHLEAEAPALLDETEVLAVPCDHRRPDPAGAQRDEHVVQEAARKLAPEAWLLSRERRQ